MFVYTCTACVEPKMATFLKTKMEIILNDGFMLQNWRESLSLLASVSAC